MSSFVRSKQAGIQNDLSASIRPELFMPDEQARYGINSQIRCVCLHLPPSTHHDACKLTQASLTFQLSRL